MAREPDPDSRPISVAEILARRAEADAADAANTDAATSNAADSGSGRRRRGGAGSFSVSELTGEQPRIGGGSAHSGSFAAIDRATAFGDVTSGDAVPDDATLAAESSFVPDPGEARIAPSGTPRYEPRASRFPRSEAPRPAADPDPYPRSEPPVGRPPAADTGRWSAPDSARPGSARPVHPATRDISAGAVRDRLDADPPAGEEATGIIPRYADGPLVAWPTLPADEDLDDLSPEERERAFERYRNFEDIPAEEVEPPAKTGGLRGVLRRLSGDRAPAEPAPIADATPTDEMPAEPVAEAPRDHPYRFAPEPERDHVDLDELPPADLPYDHIEPRALADDRVDDDPDTEVVDLDRAQLGGYDTVAPRPPAPTAAFGARSLDPIEDTDTADTVDDTASAPTRAARRAAATEEASPTRQWVVLGLQVLAGLVIGVGLFLGFTELWRWNVYFALVLSVVVIFGLVTFVHVVRRSQDLISTLLALAVGLVVTIGPLALLASGN
ncbi:hypothetical protein [Williamsia sp. Leaf354]|jgi:hypothetical protein|uniref:hypothetical protein n=1 Tax=Williamsia sp. Leaf354 TaxID=1736349 RepID=UPI000AEC9B9D|nr:hypothetical protein [Williamsia sp. Leaf354]